MYIWLTRFVVKASDLYRNMSVPLAAQPVGTVFNDRIAVSTFFFDVHELETTLTCYPPYIPHYYAYYNDKGVRPYYLPLRAFTNAAFHHNILYAERVLPRLTL